MNAVSNVAVGVLLTIAVASAKPERAEDSAAGRERWLRVQIALDDAGFRSGVIDGKWGEFTAKALGRYLRSQGKQVPAFGEQPPVNIDLPVDAEKSPLTTYQITEADESTVGKVATSPRAQAKLRSLPYGTVLEAVAEKFHSKAELLKQLNPKAEWKAGESVQVPAVATPFELAAVSELNKALAKQPRAKEQSEKKAKGADESAPRETPAEETVAIVIDTSEKMLDVLNGDRLLASYPITPGSEQLPAPPGEWIIERITWLPPFRWDKEMLMKGRRSSNAFHLPPGPNSPVGIVWMALDREGIGIHGTSEPETIGRSTSHGCVRLSNWDAFDLGQRVGAKTKVTIR